MEITIDLANLSQEDKDTVLSLLKQSQQAGVMWKPAQEEEYRYIADDGNIGCTWFDEGSLTDKYRLSSGNYFKTTAQAERSQNAQVVLNQLREYAKEHNEDIIDWRDGSQVKYSIYYDYGIGCLCVEYTQIKPASNDTVFFTSTEVARNAIKHVGVENITEHIFGIKED